MAKWEKSERRLGPGSFYCWTAGLALLLAGCGDAGENAGDEQGLATSEAPTTSAITISGRVFGENGAGVAGVTVTLAGTANATRTSDARGAYSFTNLTAGSYSVRPSFQSCPFVPSVANFNQLTGSRTQDFQRACPVAMRYRPVVLLVESNVRSQIATQLSTYVELIRAQFNVDVRVDSSRVWKTMTPQQIREYVRSLYTSTLPIQGVIMAGRLPYLIYEKNKGPSAIEFHIAPLYYEHFDAVFADTNGNGYYDRTYIDVNDPTEIWTAWWITPFGTDDPANVGAQLRAFLDKSIAFHRGQNRGTDAFVALHTDLWGFEDEFRDYLVSSAGFSRDRVVYSDLTNGDYTGFVTGLHSRLWSHMQVISHGSPDAFWFASGGYTTGTYDADPLRAITNGANFVMGAGCLNGNLNGDYVTPTVNPGASLALRFVFDSLSPTVAFFGSTDAQSTGLYGHFYEALYRGTRSAYVAMGYYDLKNSDVMWGTDHYFFRTVDDKSLAGDPFYHY